jgi:flagellar brake protein
MQISAIVREDAIMAVNPLDPAEAPDFLVRSRREVLRLFKGIMASGALISVSFLDTEEVAVTSVIHVDEASDMLLFECPAEWQELIESGSGDSIMLACSFEDSKIQFQAGRATIVDLQGSTVAGLDIPAFVWRFQRRRDTRHKVAGLAITLNLGFIECDAEVTDLSMGGIGMMNCNSDVQLEVGEVLRDCSIALPGMGAVSVDLTVQHQAPLNTADGQAVTRVGCAFTGLSASARQLIAHYLDALVAI